MCLAQGRNAAMMVSLEPVALRSRVKHSTTEKINVNIYSLTGGALFGLLGKKTNRYGRDIIVVFGYVVHMLCFYLIFINFPSQSPIEETHGSTYITSK